jgi:hypothetical protein
MTKYSIMPIVDPRASVSVPMRQLPEYNPSAVFYPASTSQGPWSGYASSVNTESELRNQIFALQKASQSVYVPNAKSDLYTYQFKTEESGRHVQPYSLLFKKEKFDSFNPNPENLSTGLFQNCTRNSIKDLTQETAIQPIQTMQQQVKPNQQQVKPNQQQVKPNQQQYQGQTNKMRAITKNNYDR